MSLTDPSAYLDRSSKFPELSDASFGGIGADWQLGLFMLSSQALQKYAGFAAFQGEIFEDSANEQTDP